MEKGNILVIGNSGVGKSTLINAVLGTDEAETGGGTSGTTKELKVYENDALPFRLIDTIGFEPAFLKEMNAVNAVKKWSKESAKEGKTDTQINLIWFCVEGTSGKLFPKAIQSLCRATSHWPSVPVIVVITKSYSVPDRETNIQMVYNAFARQKKYAKNLKNVIPAFYPEGGGSIFQGSFRYFSTRALNWATYLSRRFWCWGRSRPGFRKPHTRTSLRRASSLL